MKETDSQKCDTVDLQWLTKLWWEVKSEVETSQGFRSWLFHVHTSLRQELEWPSVEKIKRTTQKKMMMRWAGATCRGFRDCQRPLHLPNTSNTTYVNKQTYFMMSSIDDDHQDALSRPSSLCPSVPSRKRWGTEMPGLDTTQRNSSVEWQKQEKSYIPH